MTEPKLHGERFCVRYVELDEALSWLWDKNPKLHDREAIRASVRRYGFVDPPKFDTALGAIVYGNGRLQVLPEMRDAGEEPPRGVCTDDHGKWYVPVGFGIDQQSQQAAQALAVDHNNLTLLGGEFTAVDLAGLYDEEALAALMKQWSSETEDIPVSYSSGDIDAILRSVNPPEAPPEIDVVEHLVEKWDTRPGQLWQIGRHRLLCGDSTNADHVARLLGSSKPAIMVTDPPYGVSYQPGWRSKVLGSPIAMTRAVPFDNRASWLAAWLCFPGNVAYVWHAGVFAGLVAGDLEHAGFEIRAQIIWKKPHFTLSRGHYHWQHECLWYAVRKGETASWSGDRTQSTVWDIDSMGLFEQAGHDAKTGHGTQKPVECMARPMRNHDLDVVYDPFLGSGTTMVAAEMLGKPCYALEIDPHSVALALERLSQMGLEPALADSVTT